MNTHPRVCDKEYTTSCYDHVTYGTVASTQPRERMPNLVAVTIRHRGGNMSEGISLG